MAIINRLPKYVTGETLWLSHEQYSGPVKIDKAYHDGEKFFTLVERIKDIAYRVILATEITVLEDKREFVRDKLIVPESSLSRIDEQNG